jgi:hypothetical protein
MDVTKKEPGKLDFMQPLDNKTPTQEQYNRFYALAKRVFDAEPWERLEESQIVAVEGGEVAGCFVSVMGAGGKHFAVAAYSSLTDFKHVMTAGMAASEGDCGAVFEVPQIQVSFDSKTQLFPGEREAIAASGVKFKNGKFPSAQSIALGYFPWKAGAGEIDLLCVALEQLLAILDEGAEIPSVYNDDNDKLATRVFKDGAWSTVAKRPVENVQSVSLDIPKQLFDDAANLPTKALHIEADCFVVVAPIGNIKKGRPVCPRMLMMVDCESGRIIGNALMEPQNGRTWSVVNAAPRLLETFVSLGFKPESISFASADTSVWAEPLCESLGIKATSEPCDKLRYCRAKVMSLLFGGM